MDNTLESFINFCDEMQIVEEGLFNKNKKDTSIKVSKEDIDKDIKIIINKVKKYSSELNTNSSFQSKMKNEIRSWYNKYGENDKDVWEEEFNNGKVPKFNPSYEIESQNSNNGICLVFNVLDSDEYSQEINSIMSDGTGIIINKLKSDSEIDNKIIKHYGFGDGDEGILEIEFHRY